MPAEHRRTGQQQLAAVLIDFIVGAAVAQAESPAEFMINRVVEVLDDSSASAHDLPPA